MVDKITIDGGQYVWKEVSGLMRLLEFASGRTIEADISIDNPNDGKNEYGGEEFGSYGTKVMYVKEGVKYTDGTCLVCVSTKTWKGTFASYDNVETAYYILTPIAKKTAARMDRKIKKGKDHDS